MIGETLGHYWITEKLGERGMGEMFLAEDTSLQRKVAVKFLPPGMQKDDTAHKRFLREARSAPALDHPPSCRRTTRFSDLTAQCRVTGVGLNGPSRYLRGNC
jgi:serine/threonine protein kinase